MGQAHSKYTRPDSQVCVVAVLTYSPLMPRARKHLVCLSETPYYHVTSRCVRRAYLCGVDPVSGRSFEHRRGWLEDRIRLLASIFSIQLCAWAVMSNHYHLVVRLNPSESDGWTDDEVLKRWTMLFRGPLLVQRHQAGGVLSEAETKTLGNIASVYRNRLGDLSWFMKCLNEPIARQANAEDGCTGHFWEARFHSQALKSDGALLTAMAYVDLNPIRAGMARTPEDSEFTSVKARIERRERELDGTPLLEQTSKRGVVGHVDLVVRPLMPFADELNDPGQPSLPMHEHVYLSLVDQTGRIAVHGKRGRMDPSMSPILSRLGLSPEQWIKCSTAFRQNHWNGDLRVARSA